jgi:autotransporter-associated beta strand protein
MNVRNLSQPCAASWFVNTLAKFWGKLGASSLAALALFLCFPGQALAGTLTWTGGYSGANGAIWSNAANWGGVSYADNSDIVMSGTVRPKTYLGADRTVDSLTFASGADSFNIALSSEETAVPGNAADLIFSATNTGILIPVGCVNAQTIGRELDTGNVVLQGALTVALNGKGPLYILQPVTGSYGITKSGVGSLFLLGANTYSGVTTVNKGKMVVSTQGTGGGEFKINDGGSLFIDRDTPYPVHLTADPNMAMEKLTLGSTAGAKFGVVLRDGNSTVPVVTAETLTLKGLNTVAVEGDHFSLGQFPLIKYTVKTGTGTISATPASLPEGVVGTIVTNTANSSIDLLVTALPKDYGHAIPGAQTSMRIDGADDYRNNPDSFPGCKAGNSLMMQYAPASQHLFNTVSAIQVTPYNNPDPYPPGHFMNFIDAAEARGYNVAQAWVFREDWKHRPVGAGEYPEEWRVLSTSELTNIRNMLANSKRRSKNMKIIQLLGGGGSAGWFTYSDDLRNHLLEFDGLGIELHVGDSDNPNENVSAIRRNLLEEMADISKWAVDNGKVALTFMGGSEGSYSVLGATQHTYVTLWKEMQRLGVDYRGPSMSYIRQGAHSDDAGSYAGTHVPESDPDSLAYQQNWVNRALKQTSLFVTRSGNFAMPANTTAQIPFVGGKVEQDSIIYGATSSNTALVPDTNMSVSGYGFSHSLSVTPTPGQSGTTTITLSASDGIDTVVSSFLLTVTPPSIVNATTAGSVFSATTWGGVLPLDGDTQTWRTTKALNLSGSPDGLTFLGGTLELATGGSLFPGLPTADLNLGNLIMNGGKIGTGNNGAFTLIVSGGNTVFLNSGTIQSGTGDPSSPGSIRNIIFGGGGANLAGSGTIHITSQDDDFTSEVDFGASQTQGFTGVFSVHDGGALRLPHVLQEKASFGLILSGSAKYRNSADVALTSLVIDGENIAPGIYTRDDFTPAQRVYFSSSVGTITVGPYNSCPSISRVASLTIDEDTSTGLLPFTVGDMESAPGALTVTKASSDTTLVPLSRIVLSGTGASRTVKVTPALNRSGTALITLTVNDGNSTALTTFRLTVNEINDPPTISSVGDVVTNEDIATAAIPFTVGDLETPDSLVVTRSSSNLALIPVANIVLSGSGSDRTVTVTPAPNKFGTATITITVSDGALSASETFTVTVNAQPTISSITQKNTPEDTPKEVSFTIGDVETPADSLVLSGNSSNTALVSNTNLVFAGSGTSRTVTITPIPNQSGTTTITLTVTDEAGVARNEAFLLTVTAVNDPPTISSIANQFTPTGTPTAPLAFTVGDEETAASSLVVTGSASDSILLPSIALSGSGAARTVVVTPKANTLGSATVTLTVTDGTLSRSTSFLLTITGTPQETWRFAHFGTTAADGTGGDSANPDGDAWNNTQEYVIGGNPLVAGDTPLLTAAVSGTNLALSFTMKPATGSGYAGLTRYYDLETSTEPDSPSSWTPVSGQSNLSGTGPVVVTQPLSSPRCFYRLKVRLQ